MRKLALFAAVVCLISCYGMNAFGQSGRYVGWSSGVTTGDRPAGQAGMNQMCINSFPTSHMCNVDEFFSTAGTISNGIAVANNVQLWVQPALHNCLYDGSVNQVTCQEGGTSATVPQSNLSLTVRRVDLVFGG
jgi:hypothetical protein